MVTEEVCALCRENQMNGWESVGCPDAGDSCAIGALAIALPKWLREWKIVLPGPRLASQISGYPDMALTAHAVVRVCCGRQLHDGQH